MHGAPRQPQVTQASIAWADAREMLVRMKPAFDLAVTADPALATRFPSLTRLLDVRRATARRTAEVPE